MRTSVLILALTLLLSGLAFAIEPVPHAGGGGPVTPGGSGRTIVWSDTPDYEGLIGSSEVMDEFGVTSEIANDFMLESSTCIDLARWWGGYFTYLPGDPLLTSFNLRFYADEGCVPGVALLEVIIPDNANETFVYDQGGFPIYRYEHGEGFDFSAGAGIVYWFSAQGGDHPFPPQWGRLASTEVQLCGAMFRSVYFAYPDWTACEVVFGIPYDASQEFEDCNPVATVPSTWGAIRALYR